MPPRNSGKVWTMADDFELNMTQIRRLLRDAARLRHQGKDREAVKLLAAIREDYLEDLGWVYFR